MLHHETASREALAWPESIRRFSGNLDGKITLLAIPWIMSLIVLIGLVGNSGEMVQEKLEVQSAADTAAYSAALWQARGMNTLTTTNHLIGEMTAWVVIHESLGGPELDKGEKFRTNEYQERDKYLNQLQPKAPHIESLLGVPATFGYFYNIDKQIVDKVIDRIQDTDMISGATIYDGRLTLQSCAVTLLGVKNVANVVVGVGIAIRQTPFAAVGMALEGLGLGIHVGASLELIVVGKEWLVIQGLEKAGQSTVIVKQGLRNGLIPAMSFYGDLVAGQLAGSSVNLSPVNASLVKSMKTLKERHRVSEVVVYPSPDSLVRPLRLPVKAEPKGPPEGSDKDVSRPESLWSGRDEARGAMAPILELSERVNDLLDFANDIPGVSESGVIPQITLVAKKTWPQNPSDDSLPEFNWKGERITQLNRATYPYVDAYRKGIRATWRETFELEGIPSSFAAQYFTHWSNRYTVTESNRLRQDGVHLYVMEDMSARKKGNERWVKDDRRAEELFTVMGFTRREKLNIRLLPRLFNEAGKFDAVGMSQALLYNANGRELRDDQRHQPNTGWDTLNWEPEVQAPEWGDHAPGEGARKSWIGFMMGQSRVKERSAAVQLNWQAKLVPITMSRLTDSLRSGYAAPLDKPVRSLRDNSRVIAH